MQTNAHKRASIFMVRVLATSVIAAMAAHGAVVGGFSTDGNGTTATVSATGLTFGAPPNLKVTSSTLTYAGGSLAVGTTGAIANIGMTFPIPNFMTFNGTPLNFTLTSIGPGSANTDCSTANANGLSCSIPLGGGLVSPIILTYDNGATDAALHLAGTVTDGSGAVSSWTGTLGTTLTGDLSTYTNPSVTGQATPANIALFFQNHPTGSITSSHSDTFNVQFSSVPEPSTLPLLALGGVLVGLVARRRRTA